MALASPDIARVASRFSAAHIDLISTFLRIHLRGQRQKRRQNQQLYECSGNVTVVVVVQGEICTWWRIGPRFGVCKRSPFSFVRAG